MNIKKIYVEPFLSLMCLSLGSWSFNDIVGKVGKIDTTDVLDDLKSSNEFNIDNYFPDVNDIYVFSKHSRL